MSVTHRIRSCFDSCANSVLPHHEVLLQKQTSFWTDLTEPWKSIAERPVLVIGLDYGHQMFLVWIMAIKDSDGGNQSLTLHWLSADSSALGMMYFGSNILSRIWHWRCHFAQVNATLVMGDRIHAFVHAGCLRSYRPPECSADKKEVLVRGPSCVSRTWAELRLLQAEQDGGLLPWGWSRKWRAARMPCEVSKELTSAWICNK